MHPKFLKVLCCPETREPLHLLSSEVQSNGMIVSGSLTTPSGRRYPIIRGIPRFVNAEHYTSSFGYEWNRWPRLQFDCENEGGPMAGHTARMWELITQIGEDLVQNKTIVEFGCGPGRFLDVVRRKGGRAVGMDLSLAVEAARRNFPNDVDVLVVQGDILRPPFHEGVFDGGFTIGVLHHTPDPLRGLQALMRTICAGGWVSCCVYSVNSFYDFPSVARFRRLHHHLKAIFGYKAALAYAFLSAYLLTPLMATGKQFDIITPLIRYLEQNWLVILDLPDPRWRVLDIFDAITPAIASTHTGEEVRRWMEQCGCTRIRNTKWGETTVSAVKAQVPACQQTAEPNSVSTPSLDS